MAVTSFKGKVSIYFEDLVIYTGKSENELKDFTVNQLIDLSKQMEADKKQDALKCRTNDPEYARLVKKYFEPLNYLSQWFSEEEIVAACARHMVQKDLCDEYKTKFDRCPYKNAEFLRRSMEYMPRYTKSGEELAAREYCMVNVYQVSARYQGIRHGDVILDLLYGRFPELQKYSFNAYEYTDYGAEYEIYPSGDYSGINIPFAALMSGNIDAILERNRKYARSCNYGEYTPEKMEDRLNSAPAKEILVTITNMNRK